MIGLFGGTFDPVHLAHLRCALELQQALGMTELRFVPSRQPPHRAAPLADPAQRLAMLRLGIEGQPGFAVDECELRRAGPSYTVDTLEALRGEMPRRPLCLIIGLDAFVQLHTWRRWERLIELAHIAVMTRPGRHPAPVGEVADLLERCRAEESRALHEAPAGRIILCPVPRLEISATRVRALVAQGQSPRYLVPDAVLAYMREAGLYQAAPAPEVRR